MEEWIEIVPPMDPITADEKAKEWMSSYGLSDDFVVKSVRMDLLWTEEGRSLRRYLIRKRALDTLTSSYTKCEPSS